MSCRWISILLVVAKFLHLLQVGKTQKIVPDVLHPAPENQSVELAPPAVTTDTISTLKRNDWLPPSAQDVVTQTSSYTTELQQSIPPTYYMSAPPSLIPHYRSDQWNHYGYPELEYPVLPPHNNNQIAVPTKYMTVALFIGVLTLFAIIQGTMMASKRRESIVSSLSTRKKRDLLIPPDFQHMTPEQRDILNIDARIRCIQRTICLENHQLHKELGRTGIKLGNYLTRSVGKSLESITGWDRLVEDAGAAGLRGDDCNVLYRDCLLPFAFQIEI